MSSTYEQNANIVKNFLKNELILILRGDNKELMEKCIEEIFIAIDKMKIDEDFDVDIERVLKMLRITLSLINEIPLSTEFTKFIISLLNIILAWNNNLSLSNDEVVNICGIITRQIQGHYTILEAILILKQNIDRMTTFMNWQPPSFEIAKHFEEKICGK